MFLRAQATLYNVGLWLYSQDMLDFDFIDSNHVAIPVYTRLFCIKSAAKHLASCTWGISTTLHYATLSYATLHYTTPHYTTIHYTTLHSLQLQLQLRYFTLHYTRLHYTILHYSTLHFLHHHKCSCNYATLITLHQNYNSTTLQLQLHPTTLHPAVVGEVTDQATTATIVTTPNSQHQPPFTPSVGSLCHPWFTTTNISYRFPIFETSTTASCDTTGNEW